MRVLERQCARRGVEVVVVDPAWDDEARESGAVPRPVSAEHSPCGGAGHRPVGGLGLCGARVDARRVPRARRREAPGVRAAGRACLSQWLPRAWRRGGRRGVQRRPGGSRGPRRGGDVRPSPARWGSRRHDQPGRRSPGGGCPYSRLAGNGSLPMRDGREVPLGVAPVGSETTSSIHRRLHVVEGSRVRIFPRIAVMGSPPNALVEGGRRRARSVRTARHASTCSAMRPRPWIPSIPAVAEVRELDDVQRSGVDLSAEARGSARRRVP